jgi:hypothetical protein
MPIAELAARLAGNRLHIVVFGPGYGESVAVHVPDAGWLICDSLSGTGRSAGLVPAAELLRQRQEPAAMLLLTHPHDDHVAGFDRLVNRYASGPVGVLSMHLAHENFTEEDYATGVLARSNRHKALAAIARYWREHPEFKWLLTADGTARKFGSAIIEVLHPDETFVRAGQPDPVAAPNAYSTPVLIQWGEARIVLGADLPSAEWNAVLQVARTPGLADHGALKVSHHGSMGAVAEELVSTDYREAIAAVTPWHLGRGLLPKLGAGGGISWLLERRASVGLTSPGRALTQRLPQPVAHSLLSKSVQRRGLPGGAGTIEVKQSYDPDECWIAATFTRNGHLETSEFGREARLVIRG